MPSEPLHFTIFLLKDDQIDEFEKAFPEAGGIPLVAPLEGYFVVFPPTPRQPPWVSAVQQILATPIQVGLTSQISGALLVVRRDGKTLVLTFGHAWQKLEDEWLVPDFGRRVALNLVPPDKVVEVQAEQVLAKW